MRRMLHQVADFSGVRVLAFCILSNHFHVLAHVQKEDSVSDAELMRRYRVLYSKPTRFQTANAAVLEATLRQGGEEADALRSRLLERMGDVSAFMKTFKQRFSIWFNKTHRRFGPLWADRFKSVLVQGQPHVLQTMAAYIDLNPVRANLAEDPKDYRFCSYAEAVSGSEDAISAIKFLVAGLYPISDTEALANYRCSLFGRGAGRSAGARISREAAGKVLKDTKGNLSLAALLRCRIRFLTEGALLGTQDFIFEHLADWQKANQLIRSPKPKVLKGTYGEALSVMKNVRGDAFF